MQINTTVKHQFYKLPYYYKTLTARNTTRDNKLVFRAHSWDNNKWKAPIEPFQININKDGRCDWDIQLRIGKALLIFVFRLDFQISYLLQSTHDLMKNTNSTYQG